ncbi:hypothetical protein BaRGS_00038402 [Batillaria attramentaria]|uniref:Uncharacterized protein n=1 Tax=Batillaria attramentaria TaxID=370345 RepID=A0ABD0J5T7_9CAEN
MASAVAIISAASAAVSAGSSLAGTTISSLLNDGYSVGCGIEVQNWTRFPLSEAITRINGGYLSKPPVAVLPSKKEAMVTRKTGGCATGSYGTVSWKVEGLNRRVYVMWSVPFNHDYFTNWLAVGLSRKGYTNHPGDNALFDQMYSGKSDLNIAFERHQYWTSMDPIIFSDGDISLEATMGSSHKAEVRVIVRPVDNKNLADPIRSLLQL